MVGYGMGETGGPETRNESEDNIVNYEKRFEIQ